MKITSEKLKELLVMPGFVTKEDFEFAMKESQKEQISLEQMLVEKGFISDENLGKIIADAFSYHFVNLRKVKIPDDLLALIPEVVADSQKAVFFERTSEGVKLATPNIDNLEFINLLEKQIEEKILISYATFAGIEEALQYYKSDISKRVKSLIEDLKTNPADENIVAFVDLFLEYAYNNRASDIHIEPFNNTVSVRFRIDGMLHEAAEYPLEIHPKVVFRIKILSHLRTDEHASAQDGKFDFKKGRAVIDVRVSILPITYGENVVLRILSERSRRLTLEELGFLPDDFEKMKRAIEKPHGMILATGPTGSGKTTTLYAILQIVNKPEVNIMTIEDPVEFSIEHVQQIQVNPKKNLTFATGLRSIVRQDPDIVMVGEIRDNETASIAVNAAMTGHLLLSTLHANDAATAFPRLIEMGIEPFLVASSINVVIGQRLVRKICERCKVSSLLTIEETALIKAEPFLLKMVQEVSKNKDISKFRLYRGVGCKICNNTGYDGRISIFEVMEISEELRPLITGKESSDVIDKKAKELGMTSMFHDGITKVSQGITTLEEVMRVTKS